MWGGVVRAWQVCTSFLPAQGLSHAITSGSEPWRSEEQGRNGSVHLTWSLCARPVGALPLCRPPLYLIYEGLSNNNTWIAGLGEGTQEGRGGQREDSEHLPASFHSPTSTCPKVASVFRL